MEHGEYPTELSDLKDYVRGVEGTTPDLKPPKGYAYVNGSDEPEEFTEDTYEITTTGSGTEESRAYLKDTGYTAEKFYVPKKSS